jgi:hypothetical protein
MTILQESGRDNESQAGEEEAAAAEPELEAEPEPELEAVAELVVYVGLKIRFFIAACDARLLTCLYLLTYVNKEPKRSPVQSKAVLPEDRLITLLDSGKPWEGLHLRVTLQRV